MHLIILYFFTAVKIDHIILGVINWKDVISGVI